MRDWLAAAAAAAPDIPFLYDCEGEPPAFRPLSFAALNSRAAHYAACLNQLGVQPGDRVGVLMERNAALVALIFAVARTGALLVPLNIRLTPVELTYEADSAALTLLVCDDAHEDTALYLASPGRTLCTLGSPRSAQVKPLLQDAEYTPFLDGDYDPQAVQSIIFTSGTSGRPKAAQITFGNLLASAQASTARLGTQPADRWLLALPLYHIGGLSVLFRSCLNQTAVVLPANAPAVGWAANTLEILQREPITLVSLVPTQLYRMLEDGFTPNPALRLILLGGAAADPDLLHRCCERGLPVATTYGLTETTSQVATLLPQDVCRKPGSVGKPLDGMHIHIAGQNNDLAPAYTPGEIVVQGAVVMGGYLGLHAGDTLQADGLHTGDIGYLDDDGDLWVMQRRSDLIVSGGENVYPTEVETVLRQHPAIADACVVGAPDAEWGQRVAAALVLAPGAVFDQADVSAFCTARLARYKCPRLFRVVEALPLTASGKIARAEIRGGFSSAR